MVSLIGTDNDDITFTDHMHSSITVHKQKLTLKHCNHTLKVKLSSWQPSIRFYGKQSDGKAAAALCLTRENS
jgi:hypothetical protein